MFDFDMPWEFDADPAEHREYIDEATERLLAEMESAGLADVTKVENQPFYVVERFVDGDTTDCPF